MSVNNINMNVDELINRNELHATLSDAASMSEIAVATENLSRSYKAGSQKIHALLDVSLTIYRGEFVAITGASGSGKSTLLQLIGGLDKQTSGVIVVDNVRLDSMNDKKMSSFRNRKIGFVFQSFYLQPFLSLQRNLEVAAMPGRTKRSDRTARINLLSSQVGLSERLDHMPKELSGGQIQRAAVARALVNNPSIVLADEPTGNLDSINSNGIINLFDHIRNEYGTTIIIVTHDQEIAARADRVIVMQDGKIS